MIIHTTKSHRCILIKLDVLLGTQLSYIFEKERSNMNLFGITESVSVYVWEEAMLKEYSDFSSL